MKISTSRPLSEATAKSPKSKTYLMYSQQHAQRPTIRLPRLVCLRQLSLCSLPLVRYPTSYMALCRLRRVLDLYQTCQHSATGDATAAVWTTGPFSCVFVCWQYRCAFSFVSPCHRKSTYSNFVGTAQCEKSFLPISRFVYSFPVSFF
jgi:hypothetical protein